MKLLHFSFAAVGTFCVMLSSGWAQQLPDAKSAAYMWNPQMQKALYALGLYLDRNLLAKAEVCSGKVWLQPISSGVLQPLSFPEGGEHPNTGVWTIRYRFERCGESIIYNALFRANPQGPPNLIHLPPGTTRTSPQLMQDLNPALFVAAKSHNSDNKDCKVVAVTDTSITAEPTPLRVGEKYIRRRMGRTMDRTHVFGDV